jgi:hypothetical protein
VAYMNLTMLAQRNLTAVEQLDAGVAWRGRQMRIYHWFGLRRLSALLCFSRRIGGGGGRRPGRRRQRALALVGNFDRLVWRERMKVLASTAFDQARPQFA